MRRVSLLALVVAASLALAADPSWPAFRGGPMFYADSVGLAKILNRVTTFHRELGERWKPAPLLERLVAEGSTFREYDARQAP